MSDEKVICFEDEDGDILSVNKECDSLGRRYVAVIVKGDEMGVLLNKEQQYVLCALLDEDCDDDEDDEPEDAYRARCAQQAGEILRAHGSLFGGTGAVDAAQVIALASWIAYDRG